MVHRLRCSLVWLDDVLQPELLSRREQLFEVLRSIRTARGPSQGQGQGQGGNGTLGEVCSPRIFCFLSTAIELVVVC